MALPTANATPQPWDTSVGHRFAHYSPEDHSALLWIATLVSMIYAVSMFLLEVFLKRTSPSWEDGFMLLSLNAMICAALGVGLGRKPEQMMNITLAGRLVFSSRILLLLSLYLAKLSVIYLLRRIFAVRGNSGARLCDFATYFTVAGGVASTLASALDCPTSSFFMQRCRGQKARWLAVTAIDICTDTPPVLLAGHMVWRLQTKTRSKLRVIAAFSSRLIPIAFSALHFRSWSSYSEHAPSTLNVVPALVWQEVLSTVSILAAQLLIHRSLLHSISAGWEATQWPDATEAYKEQRLELGAVDRAGEGMAGSSSSTLVFEPPSGRASKLSMRTDGQIPGVKIVQIDLNGPRQPKGINRPNG